MSDLQEQAEETVCVTHLDLNTIRDKIEAMNKFNQVEVLRILSKNKNITLNENKYGVHINLSDLPQPMIVELIQYIQYVESQESSLVQIEMQKEVFKNAFFGP